MKGTLEELEWALREREVCGYRILVRAPVTPDKTKSGLIILDQSRLNDAKTTFWGKVMKLGPDAYLPEDYPRPYCQEGDWIEFSTYEAGQIVVNEHPCYYVNDSRVLSRLSPRIQEILLKDRE